MDICTTCDTIIEGPCKCGGTGARQLLQEERNRLQVARMELSRRDEEADRLRSLLEASCEDHRRCVEDSASLIADNAALTQALRRNRESMGCICTKDTTTECSVCRVVTDEHPGDTILAALVTRAGRLADRILDNATWYAQGHGDPECHDEVRRQLIYEILEELSLPEQDS